MESEILCHKLPISVRFIIKQVKKKVVPVHTIKAPGQSKGMIVFILHLVTGHSDLSVSRFSHFVRWQSVPGTH